LSLQVPTLVEIEVILLLHIAQAQAITVICQQIVYAAPHGLAQEIQCNGVIPAVVRVILRQQQHQHLEYVLAS
jgi:hypothetical protein